MTEPRGLAAIAAADPDRVALVCGGTRTTFRQLDRAANAMAHAFAAHGVGVGDRVAVMLGNGPAAFAAWYGAARSGALVVPVSTRLTAPEAAYIVGDSGAIVLVHDGSAAATEAASSTSVTGASPPGWTTRPTRTTWARPS